MNQNLHETLDRLKGPVPIWLNIYLDNFNDNPDLPYFMLNEDNMTSDNDDSLDQRFTQRKTYYINRLALYVRNHIVRNALFESFIMLAILSISVIIGMELESNEETSLQGLISFIAMAIFTFELIIKLIAEGDEPLR